MAIAVHLRGVPPPNCNSALTEHHQRLPNVHLDELRDPRSIIDDEPCLMCVCCGTWSSSRLLSGSVSSFNGDWARGTFDSGRGRSRR
jgi:hypothetical protein